MKVVTEKALVTYAVNIKGPVTMGQVWRLRPHAAASQQLTDRIHAEAA
jgi:hypothetical protein